MSEPCTMCEQKSAVVMDKWPGPVCKSCDRMLDKLGVELAELEATDPEVKRAAEEVDAALRELGSP